MHTRRTWPAYLFACATTAAALGLRLLLDESLVQDVPYLFFFISITLSAWYGGLKPDLLATFLAALAADYYLIAPTHTFYPVSFADQIKIGLFIIAGAMISFLCGNLRAAKNQLAREQQQLQQKIAEREQADVKLRRAEERIRSVVDHVVDGIITIDETGIVESFNLAAEKIFGYSASEVIGQKVEMLMPEPYRQEHDSYIANYRNTGQAKVIGIGREVVGRRKDGSTFPMDLAVSEFHIDSRRCFTGIVRDITVRKKSEEEIHRSREELSAANRHKDEFLATLAHELRNPLAPIRNAAYVMKLANDRKIREEARKTIERQVEQMVHLVDDLMDASRITQNKIVLRRAPVQLATAITNAVETAKPLIEEKGHSLAVTLPPEFIWLNADLTRLAQIFSNLLTNAAKYTEPEGRIEISAYGNGNEATIIVRDNGIGLSSATLPRIFEMFTQVDSSLDRSQGGLGIGLSLVKKLVELHGGNIEAYSEGKGKGSEFTVRLPVIEHVPAIEPSLASEVVKEQKNYRILVVDDNIPSAKTLGWMLELIGHEVQLAHDGLAALEMAKSFIPNVVLLDIGLPKMNGYEVCRRMRQKSILEHTIFVAQTGWGQEEHRRMAKESGFDYHLVKPVDMASLQKLLDSLPVPV